MATEKEWREYFELMNEREATDEEIQVARSARDIDADEIVEEVNVETRQTAPKQKAETHTVGTILPVVPSIVSEFFAWVKGTLAEPDVFEDTTQATRFGWTTLGLNAIVMGLMGAVFFNRVTSTVYSLAQQMNVYNSREVVNIMSSANNFFGIFCIVGLAIFVITLSAVLAMWATRRGIFQDKTVTFNNSVAFTGRLMVFVLLANVAALLSIVLTITGLFFLFFFIALVLFGTINMYVLFTSNNYTTMNRFYVSLLAYFVNGLIISGVFWLILLMIPSSMF